MPRTPVLKPAVSTTTLAAIALIALFCIIGGSAAYVDFKLRAQFRQQGLVRTAQRSRTQVFIYIIDEETAVRGFAATREAVFLQPYLVAQPNFSQRFEALARDLDELALPDRARTIGEMQRIYFGWTNDVAAPLIHGKLAEADALRTELQGKALIDAFRVLDADLRDKLDARAATNDAAFLATIRSIVVVNSIGFAIVGAGLLIAIARQRRVERELSERKRLLDIETISEAMPQIVWTAAADGVRDWHNHAWFEYTGCDPNDPKASDWRGIVHPDDFATAAAAWSASHAAGTPFKSRHRLRRRDGEYRWYDNHAHPVRDDRGNIVKWFGTASDIHETIVALESEKQVADMLQRAFIQKELPTPPQLGVRATYIPAQRASQVGGDWYDALLLPDKRVFFSIGDVTGHGLDAAVSMNRARQFIIAAALQNDDPASVLANANRAAIMQRLPVVTAIVGFVDPSTYEIRYATAGHPPPVLASRSASARFLPYGGIPLGILDVDLENIRYVNHTATAEPGAVFVLYTDGVIEHGRDVLRGEQRLLDAATTMAMTNADNPAGGIHDMIFKDMLGEDDVAILTFRFEERAENGTGHAAEMQSRGFGPTQMRVEIAAPPPPRSLPDAAVDVQRRSLRRGRRSPR